MSQLAIFRRPQVRASFALAGELVIDSFAGGGGASTGIEAAIGRPVDIAINHDREAISMHQANHPETKHYLEDVWRVDPREACGSRPVGLAWFSPDCTHFSRAKGAVPVSKKIRDLAWVVVRWAKAVKPRTIILENVQEFQDWGPLRPDGKPDRTKKGMTFRQWLGRLRALGYEIEFQPMVAADYGAPTTRKRLFLVARRDGGPIIWPNATHGDGRENAWIPASEIIDWTIPTRSIFGRKRPLAEKTMKRIAEGIRRYVLEAGDPFVVSLNGKTAVPTLIQTGYGDRPGQAPRVPGLEKPLGTVVAGGCKHALVAAFVTKHYGGVVGHGMGRPIGSITARDSHAISTATLEPIGAKGPEVRAFLTKYYGGGATGLNGTAQDLKEPLHTIRSKSCFGIVEVRGEDYRVTDIGMRMLQPHELYRAQGFPDDYIHDALHDGTRLTKTAQIRMCGNSVSPAASEAVVAANVVRGSARAAA